MSLAKKLLNKVEESNIHEADMTKSYDGFHLLNFKTGKITNHKYIKGIKSTEVENEAIDKMKKETGDSNFGVHGFIKKGEWV